MTITIPNVLGIVLIILIVVLVLALLRPPPQIAGAKWLYVIAAICFMLATVGVGVIHWVPLGLFCLTLGLIVG
jgi:hypothetical protein